MPTTHTYPGVYIEEIPSGVHAIVGVSTSNTAFVDFFARGKIDQAVEVTSFADFERTFGGLDPRSEASYAIFQYFLNGGQTAFVVRVGSDPKTSEGSLAGGYGGQETLRVSASSPGEWGNNLELAVDTAHIDAKAQLVDPTLFNLLVREVVTINGSRRVANLETYRNLSLSKASPLYAPTVIGASSRLISLEDKGLAQPPAPTAGDPFGQPDKATWTKLTDLADPAFGSDGTTPLAPGSVAVSDLWATSDGQTALIGDQGAHTGIYALDRIEPAVFNILCIPAAARLDDSSSTSGLSAVYSAAAVYCEAKRAFLIVDIPQKVDVPNDPGQSDSMVQWLTDHDGLRAKNAAVYFPRLLIPDPLNPRMPRNVGASGTLAGVYARTDGARGVWKAPAGIDATLANADIAVKLTDPENGILNPLGINVLRNFPIYGRVSWGARTLEGADQLTSEWKYIPVRRLALFIEESLYEGTKWAVFEPNDEPLWASLRFNVGNFMQELFRREAFQGGTPKDAYFVKCDADTTTAADRDLGIVNIVVGFAPLKPAEFVVIQIQQLAGQSAS
jgi:Bacteriophage tail sheath protein